MEQKKIAIYMRSSLEQDEDLRNAGNPDESNTIANQRKYLYEVAKKYGFPQDQIIEYVDDGHTGTNFNRPSFMQLIDDVEAEKIEVIFVKDFSRMGRDYIGVGEYMEQFFPEHNVRVISVNDNWDSAEHKGETLELDASFRTIIYEMYSRDLSVKRKSANQARNKKGTFIGAYVPYGYKKIPGDTHSIVIDEPFAEVVRRIFEMFNSGEKIGNIAKILSDESVPTPAMSKGDSHCYDNVVKDKGRWSPRAVGIILKNEMYTGTLLLNRWAVKGMKSNVCVKNDPSEWMKFPDNHEAIISKEDFEKAGKRLANRMKSSSTASDKRIYPLYCGHCGGKLRITTRNEKTLICNHGITFPADLCGQIEIRRDKLEKLLIKAINKQAKALIGQNKVRDNSDKKMRSMDKTLETLTVERDSYRSERMELYKKFKSGQIEKDVFLREKEGLLKREEECILELETLQDKLSAMKESAEYFDQHKDALHEYSLMKKYNQKIANNLVSRVEAFNDGHLKICWNYGSEFGIADDVRMTGKAKKVAATDPVKADSRHISIYTSDMFLMPQEDIDPDTIKDNLAAYAAVKLAAVESDLDYYYDCKTDDSLFFREGYMKFIQSGRCGAANILLIRTFKDLYLSNQQMSDLMFWILPKLPCRLIATEDNFDTATASEEDYREMYEKYKGVRNGDFTKYRALERAQGLREGKHSIYCTRLYGYHSEEDGFYSNPEVLDVVKKIYTMLKETHDLKPAVLWLNKDKIQTPQAFYIEQGLNYSPEKHPKWTKEKLWGLIKQKGYVEPCKHYEKCMEEGRHCDRMPIIDRETFDEVNEFCKYRDR